MYEKKIEDLIMAFTAYWITLCSKSFDAKFIIVNIDDHSY